MDMSTHDTIQLGKLQEEALKLNYPPLLLELAMQLYTGPKAVMAEQELTPFFHVDNGVPAGCPQAGESCPGTSSHSLERAACPGAPLQLGG